MKNKMKVAVEINEDNLVSMYNGMVYALIKMKIISTPKQEKEFRENSDLFLNLFLEGNGSIELKEID